MNNDTPLVSVLIITYNHEKYIAQAIESALMQKTNFGYEIVIGEDCSTDKTREIVLKFKEKYPDKIKLILQETNVGPHKNCLDTYNKCVGKYIALLEGDDYWTDPYKLQKQVDFLEKNHEYGMVCTNYNRLVEKNNKIIKGAFKKYKNEVKYDEYLIDRSSIGTATVMIKKEIYEQYTKELTKDKICEWNIGDTPLWLYIAKFYKIKVMEDITAVYRIRQNSACHFESYYERYNFVKKGFEVPFYFVKKFGAKKNTVRYLQAQYFRNELIYYFNVINFTKAYIEFKKIKETKLLKPKDIIFLIGSLNKTMNKLANMILKIKQR